MEQIHLTQKILYNFIENALITTIQQCRLRIKLNIMFGLMHSKIKETQIF